MSTQFPTIRRVLSIGLTWGLLWLLVMTSIGLIIGIVDPDSIDPGEGTMFLLIFGPMGFLSGVAFGILLSLRDSGMRAFDLSPFRAAFWGFLGSAIVQVGYLGRDSGLAANIQMALVLCAFGGVISAAWLFIARWWSHRRSLQSLRQ